LRAKVQGEREWRRSSRWFMESVDWLPDTLYLQRAFRFRFW